MKLSAKEKAALRAAFRTMSPKEKLDYILTYYNYVILLILAALFVLGSVVHHQLSTRDPVLYLGFLNVGVGEDLELTLGDDYLRAAGHNPRQQEVYLYKDLYLTDDASIENQEYAYASRIKLMAAVSAQKLDLVLMNRESWDLLSRGGYLLALPPLLESSPALAEGLLPLVQENEVVLSENNIEYQLGEAEALQVETESVSNALRVNDLPLFAGAEFPEEVWLGVIANSPRQEEIQRCLDYLVP